MKKLLILGAGGYGRTVADLAEQLGIFEKIAFLDDRKEGPDILGTCEEYHRFREEYTDMYPAIGNNAVRLAWLDRLLKQGIHVPVLAHPRAYVSPTACLAPGSVVLAMAAVNTGSTVERGALINLGALVDHDCVIGAGAHLAPGAIVKAGNRIPEGMKIESGTVIANGEYPL